MLTRARQARMQNSAAMDFCFELAHHEQNYRKMIEYIDSSIPYKIILKYFEFIIQGEKTRLLEALMNKSDSNWFVSHASVEADRSCFPELFALAEKHYTRSYLLAVILQAERKNRMYYDPNRFVAYMKKQLISS